MGKKLPLEAWLCVSAANGMIKKGEIHKAIVKLEKFRAKQKTIDKALARKRGYNHYYIDFLLGNYYLMLSYKIKLSNSKLKKQYMKKAVASYRQAVKKKPDLNPAWLNLAKCFYELNNMAMAAKAFLKGYETAHNKKGIYLYYASICFANAGDRQNALKYALLLTKKYPMKPKWWKVLSNIYLGNNDMKKGLTALVCYGFLTPLNRDETSLAADLYLSLGVPSKAAFYYEKLLRKKIDRKILNRIVYAYMDNHQVRKALKWVNKGLALYKSDKALLSKKKAIKAYLDFENHYGIIR